MQLRVRNPIRTLGVSGTYQQTVTQRFGGWQLGFLLDEGDSQSRALLQLAVIQEGQPRYDAYQRRFSRAVASDEPEPFAAFNGELRSVQKRAIAVGEMTVE